MFYAPKAQLRELVQSLQIEWCVYQGEHCDCKFGATCSSVGFGSEKGNGCPEMRCLTRLLLSMTDEEYRDIMDRADI